MMSMACSSTMQFPLTTSAAVDQSITAAISSVHPDITGMHILTRLDGPTLASAACSSSELRAMACQESLWADICSSTWPSTNEARLRQVISTFPNGARSFFSDCYPVIATPSSSTSKHVRTSELISAVDVYYRGKLIFSKVVETETVTGWFLCAPLRVDLLDPKDTVPTPIPQPETEDSCGELAADLTLSWIVLDPDGRRAMNLSSQKPVSVQRHWLSGEVHVRFASILGGDKGSSSEYVQCGIVVTCGSQAQAGTMQVREVSLQMEDMDGMHLNGKDSLVILQKALEGKRGKGGRRAEEGRKTYSEYLEKKEERRERKLRREWALDMLGVASAVFIFASFGLFFCWRR